MDHMVSGTLGQRALARLSAFIRLGPTRMIAGVNQRMLAIILLATLPMAALCAISAWDSYDRVRAANIVRSREIRDYMVERLRVQRDVAITILTRLAASDPREPGSRCEEMMRFLGALEVLHHTRLSLLDADRHTLCGDATVPDPDLLLPAPGRTLVLPDPSSPRTLDIVSRPLHAVTASFLLARIDLVPPMGPAQTGGHVRGGSDDIRLWLRFADGGVRALCPGCGWGVPDGVMWPTAPGAVNEGMVGQDNFASGALDDGVDLLVVIRSGERDAQALSEFLLRVIEIALIMGAALLLVVVAANLAIVAPIDELTRAVTRWRAGGVFQRGRIALMPTELRRLWEAFAAAVDTLSRHEADLAAASVKQGLLIKEIHHRVKNNLQIIASLLNLQASRIKNLESKTEFASARDRVRALATLHRHLYQEGEPESMHLRGFLEELCTQLFQAMGERPNGRIRLAISVPDVEMPADQAVPIALIVTEAVSNAVKYAFPGGRSGHVAVSLDLPPDGQTLRLVIEDDGIGLPEGRTETESGVRDGLGIQLIRGFARQLGATLEVQQPDQARAGTIYRLLIPRMVATRGVRL